MGKIFINRGEAGRLLADRLMEYANRADVLVLALPRGGVPVGYEVARRLNAPLDVFVVRKLGVPWQPELAMGAIASGNVRVLNDDVVRAFRLSEPEIDAVAVTELRELARRERSYRGGLPIAAIRGMTVILVDDGIATGTTLRAAIAALKELGPARIVVAAPVAARSTRDELKAEADEVVCVATPEALFAVSQWYVDFEQTTDAEVHDLLERSSRKSVHTAAKP